MKKWYFIFSVSALCFQHSIMAQNAESQSENFTADNIFRTKITKQQIQSSAKTGLFSLLSTQTVFFQKKNGFSYHSFSSTYLKYEFDGMDIKDPMTGELAFSPILEILDNISIGNKFIAGTISLTSEMNDDKLKSSVGYLLDGVRPSSTSRGYQSVFGFVNGPIPEFNAVKLSFAVKRSVSQSLWVNGEPISEFYDGVNISNIPVRRQIMVGANNERDSTVNSTLDLYAPNYRKGGERTQYDMYGKLSYENDYFTIGYQSLLMVADGRTSLGINYALVDKNRPSFEQMNQLHRLTFSQKLNDNLRYAVSVDYFRGKLTEHDPTFKDNVAAYGDPNKNPMFVYGNNNTIYYKQSSIQALNFTIYDDLNFMSSFHKMQQDYLQFSGELAFTGIENLTAAIGFINRSHEIRSILFNPVGLKSRMNNYERMMLDDPAHYKSGDLNKYLARSIGANNYGFDVFGNETDSNFDGPLKPSEFNLYTNGEYNLNGIGTFYGGLKYQRLNLGGIGLNDRIRSDNYFGYLTEDSYFETETENNIGYNFEFKTIDFSGFTFWLETKKDNIVSGYSDYYTGIALTSRIVLGGGNAFNQPLIVDPKSVEAKSTTIGVYYNVDDLVEFKGSYIFYNLKNSLQLRTAGILKDGVPSQIYAFVPGGETDPSEIELQAATARWNYIKLFARYNKAIDKISGSGTGQFRTVWSTDGFASVNTSSSTENLDQLSATIDFHANQENEITDIVNEFGFSIGYQRHSGHPYTRIGGYLSTNSIPSEAVNSSVTPPVYTIDLTADFGFTLSSMRGFAFVKVENLTNRRNIYNVFGQTGSAYDDGYLATEEGKKISNINPDYQEFYAPLYNAFVNQNNPEFFGSPRTVTFGVRFDF